ncbi:MAG: HD domain-containing protein [Syntrophorhabdales bacterium]|jgi:putative hydrolase of HD superfamily
MENPKGRGVENRLDLQLRFIIEIDRLKHIMRRTRLFDNSRHENDAEHGWHLAMMAMALAEYSNKPVDVNKVVRMVLVHDIVEIDAGDTFLYDEAAGLLKEEAERKAAERIFGLLPDDQARELKSLWEEFEARTSAEARFAAAIDRLEPMMQNALTAGHAWKQHNVRKSQVVQKNRPIVEAGSRELWRFAETLIARAVEMGHLAD